ncbi:MAG: hypothetical protein K2J40_01895 [Ruminococcus sp.]|nr:hypothetical protein [Ruminococcus sp.]
MFLINEIILFLAADIVFMQAFGTSELLVSAGNRKKSFFTSVLITLFTSVGSVMAYFANGLLPEKYSDLKIFCYVLVSGMLCTVSLKILSLAGNEKFSEYRNCIYISAFGNAVIGTFFTVSEKSSGIGEYFSAGLTSGLGFAAASLILSAAYRKLTSVKVPAAFRGFPAILVYLGVVSMAVYALK